MKKKPLYIQIIDYIQSQISRGKFQKDEQLPTEMELSKLFNTSRATVIKALNELESEGVIYRVQGKGSFVAGYERKSNNKLKAISLIIPFSSAEHSVEEINIIKGAESYLKDKEYSLMVHCVSDDPNEEMETIIKCKEEMSEGIIIYPTSVHFNLSFMYDLVLDNYPVVFMDRQIDGLPVACVQSDNLSGGYMATMHLLQQGYEDIYFISDIKLEGRSSVRERYFGYCKALKEQNRPIRNEFCIEGYAMNGDMFSPFTYHQNPDIILGIWSNILQKSKGKKIGIVSVNDAVANSFLNGAIELKLQVPKDVGITGFDDGAIAKYSSIPITTVRQNFFKIGRVAAQIIIKKIKGENINGNVSVDVKLVKRASTVNNARELAV